MINTSKVMNIQHYHGNYGNILHSTYGNETQPSKDCKAPDLITLLYDHLIILMTILLLFFYLWEETRDKATHPFHHGKIIPRGLWGFRIGHPLCRNADLGRPILIYVYCIGVFTFTFCCAWEKF